MSDFDALTEQMIAAAERDILPYLEVEHINQRLELREKQLQELADVRRNSIYFALGHKNVDFLCLKRRQYLCFPFQAMRRLNPKEELIMQYEKEAARAMDEARRYQQDTLKKMREEMERRKEEIRKREEDRKKKMAQQLA